METVLRLQIYCFCLIVIAILWFSGDRRKTSRLEVDTRLYHALMLSIGSMLLIDTILWLLIGTPGSMVRAGILVFSALYYIVHTLPIGFFILYADYLIFRNTAHFRRLAAPLLTIEGILAIISIASVFTGSFFTVDPENHYVRGPLLPVLIITQYVLVVSALGLIVLNRKRLKRRVFIALLTNPIPTLVAGMIQVRFYGLVLIWPVATLYLIVSFSNIENRRSKTDYLTGTANRRSLDEELERRIEFSKSGRTLCGLLLDIDDFKVINDRFGHEAGDRALDDVANILLASVRVNDHVARMGGDEFVVLFDLMEPSAMEDLVHRIETAIENLNASKQRPYRISSSIGRSIYRQEDGGSASDFLSILDADMYARKKNR